MPPIRNERRWMVLVFCALYSSFTFGLISGFTFWAGPWMRDFKVPRTVVMTCFTGAFVVWVLVSPLVGRALDVVSVRVAVIVGAIVMATGLVLMTVTHAFWQLFVAYSTLVPVGIVLTGILPATVLCVRVFPGRAGLINGVLALAQQALSPLMMAGLSSVLIAPVGWRGIYLVAAGLISVVIAPVAWFLLNVGVGAPASTKPPSASEATVAAEGFHAFREPVFWAVAVAAIPFSLALPAISTNLVAFAADSGIDIGRASVLVSVYAVSSGAGTLTVGWLSDRLDPRLVYGGMLTLFVPGLLIMARRPDFSAMAVAFAALGLGGSAIMPWAAAVFMRRFDSKVFARVFGLFTLFFLAAAFSPILIAWIRDKSGGYQMAFLAYAALMMIGFVSLFLLGPASGKSAADLIEQRASGTFS